MALLPPLQLDPTEDPDAPLNPLQSHFYDFKEFKFPSDLGDNPSLNHYMVFFINESRLTQDKFKTRTNITSFNPSTALGTLNTNAQNDEGGTNSGRNTTRIPVAIALYMPPSIITSNTAGWGEVELGLAGAVSQNLFNAGSPDLKKGIDNIIQEMGVEIGKNILTFADKITDLNIRKTAELGLRVAVNTHKEVLFHGIPFRVFQFDFKFTPRSVTESQIIKNIIQAFKFYGAPEINVDNNASGKYFIYPAEFDIKFYSNGQENTFINKISTCALINIQVNYTGSGMFSSFAWDGNPDLNGVPTDIILSLTFLELELMHKARIIQGF